MRNVVNTLHRDRLHICFGCGVALGSPPLTAQARSTFWDHRGKTLTAPVATAR
jgi:hypothetical protein